MILDWQQFVEELQGHFLIDAAITKQTEFTRDLGFDSLEALELIVVIESMSGCEGQNVIGVFPFIPTVGAAFELYSDLSHWIAKGHLDSDEEEK